MHAPGTLGRLVSISTGARPHLGPEVGGADVLAHGHPAGAQVVVLSKQLQAPPAARARRAGRAACGVSAARWAGHQPRPRAPASAVGGTPAQTKGTSQQATHLPLHSRSMISYTSSGLRVLPAATPKQASRVRGERQRAVHPPGQLPLPAGKQLRLATRAAHACQFQEASEAIEPRGKAQPQ